jgi:hypothetical protein
VSVTAHSHSVWQQEVGRQVGPERVVHYRACVGTTRRRATPPRSGRRSSAQLPDAATTSSWSPSTDRTRVPAWCRGGARRRPTAPPRGSLPRYGTSSLSPRRKEKMQSRWVALPLIRTGTALLTNNAFPVDTQASKSMHSWRHVRLHPLSHWNTTAEDPIRAIHWRSGFRINPWVQIVWVRYHDVGRANIRQRIPGSTPTLHAWLLGPLNNYYEALLCDRPCAIHEFRGLILGHGATCEHMIVWMFNRTMDGISAKNWWTMKQRKRMYYMQINFLCNRCENKFIKKLKKL